MYGQGISKAGELIDLGVDHEIVQKSGSWYSYDNVKIAQGRDAAKQFLLDNPELADELENKIKATFDNPRQQAEKEEVKPAEVVEEG